MSGQDIEAPLVSICIPVYNAQEFIEDAIYSAQMQTYTPIEIIVVDNCSSDNTLYILKNIQLVDCRVKVFVNEENCGMVENFNRSMTYAKGKYIKFLCADDLLSTECVAKMVCLIERSPNCNLVSTSRVITNIDLKPKKISSYANYDCELAGVDVINDCFYGFNLIGEPTAVMIRNGLGFKFDNSFPQLMDLEFWFRILEGSQYGFIYEPLVSIRQHSAQGTVLNKNSNKIVVDNIRIHQIYQYKPYISKSFILRLKKRVLMALRIYRSRDFIASEDLNEYLAKYGSKCIYKFMRWVQFLTSKAI